MANLTAPRSTKELGDAPVLSFWGNGVPVEASTHCWQGGLAAVNLAGNAVPASTAGAQFVIGRFEEEADNSGNAPAGTVNAGSGVAGNIPARIRRGVFKWDNGTGVDAISAAQIGSIAYAIDDHTVGGTAGTVTVAATVNRAPVGRIIQVDSDGVYVETGLLSFGAASSNAIDLVFPASASASVGRIVKLNSGNRTVTAALGDKALGVLINAPSAVDTPAIVRVFGLCPAVLGGAVIAIGTNFESSATGTSAAVAPLVAATGAAGSIVGTCLTASAASGTFAAFICPYGIQPTSQA